MTKKEVNQTVLKNELTEHEKDLQRIANFRLMDDDFMSEVFDDNISAVELLLSIILERSDLKVISVQAQAEYKSATMRSIKLDVKAEDISGKIYDIEIQRSDHGSGVKRARVHSSMIDRTLLEKGQDFDEITDTYVIFITENDKFKLGAPIYHIERTIRELENESFGDGSHIIYVNGEYRNTQTPIGKLMHDFNCKNADDMLYPQLSQSVRYYKESQGGKDNMCRELERMREETAKNNSIKIALGLISNGTLTYEQIAEICNLTLEEVTDLANCKTA